MDIELFQFLTASKGLAPNFADSIRTEVNHLKLVGQVEVQFLHFIASKVKILWI